MKRNRRYLGLAAALLFAAVFSEAEAGEPKSLFRSDQILEVTLDIPLRDIGRRNLAKDEELPGKLILNQESGPLILDIKVRLRGITRQSREICLFPPLRLNFRKKQLEKTIFDGQDKLKLVTYCKDSKRFEQFYLKEYLAYRLSNAVTEASFKVRLARITYKESSVSAKPKTIRYGFFIEDVDDLANRLDLEEINISGTQRTNLDPLQGAVMALHQYMIGNLDWSMNDGPKGRNCCHNFKLLQAANGQGPIFPVAYDFDFSGFVDASYANPPEGIRVRNVRQRLYRGYCHFNDRLPEAIALFNSAKPDVEKMIGEFKLLGGSVRDKAGRYIRTFYEIINDPKRLQRNIYARCRG